jgi:NAD(P)-dependent dehydrogenase (short-subunit alcohol dehydrogenase family)
VASGNILITGASTGIGQACAIRFAELGYQTWAGVRKTSDGERLQVESPNIKPVLLDVTSVESIESAFAAIGEETLAGLINNAGIAVTGPLELVPLEQWRLQFETNVIGLVSVTQKFLPLIRRGLGRIVNIGSIAGRSALPGSSAYDSSKFAIEAISDALRMELHPLGVSVSLIEPGAVATPIWKKTVSDVDELSRRSEPEKRELYAPLLAKIREEAHNPRGPVPASEVVKAVEHAITSRKPRTRYLVGLDTRLWLILNLLPDRWRDKLIMSNIHK